jgi:putative sterol carrier protein
VTTTAEVMEALPERFRPRMAGNMEATIQFDLSGEGGGQWYLIIRAGTCSVARGQAESPDAKVIMAAADFVGINTGAVSAVEAFWSGRIRVEGELEAVLALPPVMDWR